MEEWKYALLCMGYFVHVVSCPKEVVENFVLQGIHDMIYLLKNELLEHNGVKLIPFERQMRKREHSYQLLPGSEHVRRFFMADKIFP